MSTQLRSDCFGDSAALGIRNDSLERLVTDFEDLVDWAADFAAQLRRAREALQDPLFTLALAALSAVAVTLLVTRGSR